MCTAAEVITALVPIVTAVLGAVGGWLALKRPSEKRLELLHAALEEENASLKNGKHS